ncbi:hypothetical protein [Bacillus thuringiensis]|uniref:hypothetical protein n=1 Tax=Bacillus thuringiensis TaxID=1428 RepID=UPI00187552E9|nr:hypothetical protein [Bacillus thuringiensis]MBE5096787.1 hypothetical protein [Bacillus thuringiensis]
MTEKKVVVVTEKVEDMDTISIHRFIFVMKAIAENNLWDEVALHFEEKGHEKIQVFSYQIGLLKDALNEQVSRGETINKRGQRFMRSVTCGPKYPPRPPE